VSTKLNTHFNNLQCGLLGCWSTRGQTKSRTGYKLPTVQSELWSLSCQCKSRYRKNWNFNQSASCPVHGPWVVQLANWPVRDLTSLRFGLSASWPATVYWQCGPLSVYITVCMNFFPRDNSKIVTDNFPSFTLCGQTLDFVPEFRYLGNIINDRLSVDNVINR